MVVEETSKKVTVRSTQQFAKQAFF